MGEVVRLDNDKIDIIEKVILAAPQVDLQTTHHIVDGHYYRTILVPAASYSLARDTGTITPTYALQTSRFPQTKA